MNVDNEWRETVRRIFDLLMFNQSPATLLEKRVLKLIEDRHHDYFCVGKTFDEWEMKQ